ncbi:helix-turn-helix domain-containing protein [Deinococcus murrayi]|uniref:helix-turn-helix domain-containing protein n=1 Tax=Deinococcus murrayi TaxID=68910 RepID=UPI000A03F1A2
MVMPDLTFGQLVARERAARSWSQDELAAKSGLSTRAVSAIEQGRVKDPRISTVRALARALGESFFAEAYRYTDIRESV